MGLDKKFFVLCCWDVNITVSLLTDFQELIMIFHPQLPEQDISMNRLAHWVFRINEITIDSYSLFVCINSLHEKRICNHSRQVLFSITYQALAFFGVSNGHKSVFSLH